MLYMSMHYFYDVRTCVHPDEIQCLPNFLMLNDVMGVLFKYRFVDSYNKLHKLPVKTGVGIL